MDLPDPVEAIKFRMDQMGLKNKDLVGIIGSKSKVSEVLIKNTVAEDKAKYKS
jgi:HTH-type transcriptional regulator/antitoxin HigA